MPNSLFRIAYFAAQWGARRRFIAALAQPRRAQDLILRNYVNRFADLSGLRSLADFRNRVPLSRYQDWENSIAEARSKSPAEYKGQGLKRWELTSGSTHARKFIPYTDLFVSELDRTLSTWMADLVHQEPRLRTLSQYWSLSWCPPSLRTQGMAPTQDDSELFSPFQRFFLERLFAVAPSTALEDSETKWLVSTITQLLDSRDLGLVSVWSPSFLLNLVKELHARRSELAVSVSSRVQAEILLGPLHGADLMRALWPHLALISCWTSSTSAYFVPQLRDYFPQTTIQAKGLWATEGVVTLPFGGHHPLAVQSHFFEFIEAGGTKLYLPEELKKGQLVEPVLSTGTGLWRYRMGDLVRVRGFVGNGVPDLEFVGRVHTTDLVGEKLSHGVAQEMLQQLRSTWGPSLGGWVAVLPASSDAKPYYALLWDGDPARLEACQQDAEERLTRWHHYEVARKLGQLSPLQVIPVRSPSEVLQRLQANSSSALAGQRKLEAIIVVHEDDVTRIRSTETP
jgi:hypothetical protein